VGAKKPSPHPSLSRQGGICDRRGLKKQASPVRGRLGGGLKKHASPERGRFGGGLKKQASPERGRLGGGNGARNQESGVRRQRGLKKNRPPLTGGGLVGAKNGKDI